MIYFMQPVGGGPIKIGYSKDVQFRKEQLESDYREELVLLATLEGDREQERQWHNRFSHLRIGRTEQFRPGEDLLNAIGLMATSVSENQVIQPMSPRNLVMSMKGSSEFREWLNELAEFDRSSPCQIVEKGMILYAKQIGFNPSAPKRTSGR